LVSILLIDKASNPREAKSCRARVLASEDTLKLESHLTSMPLWGSREDDFVSVETMVLVVCAPPRGW